MTCCVDRTPYIIQTIYPSLRPAIQRISISFIYLISLSETLTAKNCFNTGLNGTVINLPCNQNCVAIPVRIPHMKSTSDYMVNTISYTPYPYTTATGNELINIYVDDKYSELITMPFNFCFYDSIYGKIALGSNGTMTFDETTALQVNAVPITQPILAVRQYIIHRLARTRLSRIH
jgi:hypothetical protein